ncbi:MULTISPECIES: helix-turn-helix domain-containing protein [Microbacterium]|uniref:helix-turn-helix domain-containing protein n=1 Tax=Microbacterium TaxID=33882 RepID=UPI001ABFFED4|nr:MULTISPECIES: AraC family transcriptional regulator [Microbacterium]MBT2496931.1 helix-turn-helix domain-containing protein [Microbacterium sp. ISL-59]
MRSTALAGTVPENSIRFLGHDTHEHDEPHVVYVVTGSAVLTVDGVDIPLGRHEAAWLQPHVPHAVRVREGGTVLGPILEDAAAPSTRVRVLGVVPALVDVMTTALVAAPSTDEQILPFRRAIARVLETVSRPYFPVVYPEHPAARRLAKDALRLPLPLDELSARHRMSARQVQRIFVTETGWSFSRWRGRARMNAAVAHLVGGGDLTAAARLSGFRTRAGLVKALSRETGIPADRLTTDARGALADA